MNLIYALLLTIFAGLINGACIAPKHILSNWEEENIWFCFYLNCMVILPIVTIFVFIPGFISIISEVQILPLAILVLGGLFFGLGQVCFAIAFKHIGFSINYVINISIGTAFTALIGLLLSPELIMSLYGFLQIAGAVLFVFAVTLGGLAGISRDKAKASTEKSSSNKAAKVQLGVFLAIIAGVGSAFEGSAYVLANPQIVDIAVKLGYKEPETNFLSWIVIFISSSIPTLIYFANLIKKSRSSFFFRKNVHYFPITLIMGFGSWASVLIFSWASSLIGGKLAPTIVWPMFMVFIILTSNLVGFLFGEWKNAPLKAYVKIWASILTFIVAIVIFSCSAAFK